MFGIRLIDRNLRVSLMLSSYFLMLYLISEEFYSENGRVPDKYTPAATRKLYFDMTEANKLKV